MLSHRLRPPPSGTLPSLMRTFRPPQVRQTDWINPLAMLVLGVVGIFFIESGESFTGNHQAASVAHLQWAQQIVWLALGAGLYVAVASVDYHVWMKNAWTVYLGGLVLVLLLWTPLGEVRSGARRWLGIGSYTIQPTEFAKIASLIMVANVLARAKLGTIKSSLAILGKVGLVVLPPIVLIFLQPDLGSSLVFFPTVFALLYVSNLSARFFVTVFGLFLVAVAVLGWDVYRYYQFLDSNQLTAGRSTGLYEKHSWLPLKDYQRDRVLAYFAPRYVDPQGIGVRWNQIQSQIAVGTGGLTGKGFENGTQARLGYLPPKVATSDFIMAVFLEETGFLGGLAVISLYAILLGNTLRIAGLARDRFGQLLCVGVAVIFLVHVFVNLGMVQGLMPVKGIPIPLLSYGGTFVLSCCILMGLVQSVYRHRREAV